jgi:hypothetical protein
MDVNDVATVPLCPASWTAWVTDNSWTPHMSPDVAITQLTDFGQDVKVSSMVNLTNTGADRVVGTGLDGRWQVGAVAKAT